MSVFSCYSGWGHHPSLHHAVESRKKLQPWPANQHHSSELRSPKQDMGIVTPLYKFVADASVSLPYSEVIHDCIITECLQE